MRLTVRTAAALLALATFATYANSLGGVYVFDDTPSLTANPTLHDWRQIFSPPGGAVTVSGRPILNASFALSSALGHGAPWGHHVVNVLIHLAAGLALFGIVHRTLQLPSLAPRFGPHALPLGFFVALLWTLHPLQTESVTYLVQRAESLMGLFFLLAFYAYLRGATAGTRPEPGKGKGKTSLATASSSSCDFSPTVWFTLSVTACLFGVGTKEVIVVVPLLVPLHDRTFVAGSFAAAWRARRVYYCALFGTWLPLAALVLSAGGSRAATSDFNATDLAVGYWLTQFEALTRYLLLSIWPHPLVFEYGTFRVQNFAAAAPYALAVIPLALATVWALWRRPQLGFLGAWFFAILAPTSLIPGKLQMIVEHRMYLSLAAVLVLLTVGLYAWLRRRALWPAVLAALACSALTATRNLDYRSELSLWSDTVAKRPANATARNGLALAQLATGDTTSAIAQFEAALAADPTRADSQANLSLVLGDLGRVDEALRHGEAAVRLAPASPSAHGNLGVALLYAHRPAEAVQQLETALRLDPHSPDAHNSLGVALIQLGRAPEALPHFETALRLKPDYARAQDNLTRLRALLAHPQ